MAPAPSMRQKIITALKTRVQAIRQTNGFSTDAGQEVTHGYQRPGAGDTMPRTAIVPDELPETDAAHQDDAVMRVRWPIHFIALAKVAADDVDPLDTAELLLADLKRGIFLADRSLGGVLAANQEIGNVELGGEGTVDREDGGQFVAAHVTALVTFDELYGAPESR